MRKYSKLIAAILAGLAVAVPALVAANSDGTISLQEWLTILGLFLPAVGVGFSPANALSTKQLVEQVDKNPSLVLRNDGLQGGSSYLK